MRRITFFLTCLLIGAGCLAQQYPFIFYTPKNGLVNSRVRKMYQDSRGRLYFITYGGLSVYDGARFRNYTKLNGLASDMTNDVIEAGEDSFFVATNTSKLNVLANGEITDFKTEDNFCPTINHFLKSSDGHIYLTADEGLFIIDNKKIRQLSFNLRGSPAISPFLGDILEYGNMLLIGTNDLRHHIGLYLYDRKNRRLSDSMPGIVPYAFGKDKKNQVWISVTDRTAMLDSEALKNGKLKLTSLPASYQHIARVVSNSFAFDENNTWIIHNGKEIIKTDNDGSLLKIRMPDNAQGDKIFVDRENIVWVCNTGAGAFKLVNTTLQIDEIISGNTTDVINLASYANDTTWFIVNFNQFARKASSGTQVFTLDEQKGIFMVQQINGRLILFDEKNIYSAPVPSDTQRKIHLSKLLSLPDSSFGGLCVADPHGNLIITESGHITVIQKDSIIFRYPLALYDLVQSLQFDAQGRLWVASRASALTLLSLHPENPSHYLQPVQQFKKDFGNSTPRAMLLDKKGMIWLGTRHEGLLAFTYENHQLKKVAHLQTQQGLTDNFITSLAVDSAGHIIAGTQTGLDRLIATAKNEYRIENITKSNSLFGFINTIWVNASNHCYALFNNRSVLQILPLSASQANYQPDLFIEEIKTNGTKVNSSARNIKFSYSQRNLSFNVAAPAFIDEQQIKYSYLLEGSGNTKWSEPSGNAGINFVNLPAGEYRLLVKAIFPSTSYSSQQISWPFEIIPPWWQRTWFRILAAILIITIIILIIRFYYIQKLKNQKTVLEKQQAVEKERTRIATDMHDDLGAGLSRIKFLSETIGIKKQQQQPIEEDISKIREYSHDMIDKMGEIVWALNKDNDTLSDLISYTRSYAVEYLSQNGIQCSVEAPEHFPSSSVSGEFRRNIHLTVKEALHNIVKHSGAGHVHIRIQTAPILMISLSDNGSGFDQGNIRPFSNGLTNMKKRMESIGGKLEIKNGTGTTVSLSTPIS
jgi:signal transduction histidine kinase/streptogramin lyase